MRMSPDLLLGLTLVLKSYEAFMGPVVAWDDLTSSTVPQKSINRFSQGVTNRIGQGNGFVGSRLLRRWIALDKNRRAAEVAGRFDIGDRIANHQAIGGGYCWKIPAGLIEQSGLRLSTVAFILIMRTVVKRVDARPAAC